MHRTAEGNVPEQARIDAELLKDLLDYVEDGVCLLDLTNHILYWNHGAEQITGYLAQEVAGRHCSEELALCSDCEGAALSDGVCPLARVKQDGKPREAVIYVRHRAGYRLPVRMRAHAILDDGGQVAGVVEVFARAYARGRTELARAARHRGHDALTGVLNRDYGEMRLRHELEVMETFGVTLAWLRVELEHGEELRQHFGHGMVDAAMRMIAHTIDANLNSLDMLALWDETSFRVMVRHAVEPGVAELARKLALMVSASEVEWWGEGRKIGVRVASVTAQAGDTAGSLEQRIDQPAARLYSGERAEPCSS